MSVSPLGISTLSDTLHPYKVRHHSLQCHLIPTMGENENQSSRKNHINPATAPHQTGVRRQVPLASELWCKRCVGSVGRGPDIHHGWHLTVSQWAPHIITKCHPSSRQTSILISSSEMRMSDKSGAFYVNLYFRDEGCPYPGQTQSH